MPPSIQDGPAGTPAVPETRKSSLLVFRSRRNCSENSAVAISGCPYSRLGKSGCLRYPAFVPPVYEPVVAALRPRGRGLRGAQILAARSSDTPRGTSPVRSQRQRRPENPGKNRGVGVPCTRSRASLRRFRPSPDRPPWPTVGAPCPSQYREIISPRLNLPAPVRSHLDHVPRQAVLDQIPHPPAANCNLG